MARLLGTVALAIMLSTNLAAQLAVADAGAFMGTWSLNLESPQGSFEQTMVLKDEGGKAVAELSSQMAPDVQKVTDQYIGMIDDIQKKKDAELLGK